MQQTGNLERENREQRRLTQDDIACVPGYEAYDKNNQDVGNVTAVWTDRAGAPAFIGIQTSWLMGKTHVVPSPQCEVNMATERIRVPYDRNVIESAPSYDPDFELTEAKEREVNDYYRSKGGHIPEYGYEARPTGPEGKEAAKPEEVSMPLHEEKFDVGKRSVDIGGVRLRKVVRTERVERPVDLKREDVVIERVPAQEKGSSKNAFRGEDVFIPLRAEEPVITKETEVREEVRAKKTSGMERERVTGEIRKEDVKIDDTRNSPKR